MKVLLGHPGLRGDLVMNLPTISYLCDEFGWDIDMPLSKRFIDMMPLFANHPKLRSVFVTDEYDNFPSQRDREGLAGRDYDRVFNPMQRHTMDRWFERMHQTDAVLFDYMGMQLPAPRRQIQLTQWFDTLAQDKSVAFAPFAGFTSNPNNDKRLSVERAEQIATYVMSKGYRVVLLGGPGEPSVLGVSPGTMDYFTSVRVMLGCGALIHTDTGLGWVASGYQFPQLGLYGHRYYYKTNVANIQPVNPRGIYLDAPTVGDIPFDQIAAAIDQLLS